jgi:hypothetical protein
MARLGRSLETMLIIGIVGGALIGGALIFKVAKAYNTLRPVEVVVLWWWAAICVCGLALLVKPVYPLAGSAGLLMVGLGLFIAFNVRAIADRLSERRIDFLWAHYHYGPKRWQLHGALLAAIGAVWTLAFGQAF